MRAWTTKERQIVAEFYPTGGVLLCQKKLPDRSDSAIRKVACNLNLKVTESIPRKRRESNDKIDTAIRRFYDKPRRRGDLLTLSCQIDRPESWIRRRAYKIGAVERQDRSRWSDRELNIIDQNEGKPLNSIRLALKKEGFHRTEIAIKRRITRRGGSSVITSMYSARDLALAMGVSNSTVVEWCKSKKLKSDKKCVGGKLHIKPIDVKKFIVKNVENIDLRRINSRWLVDILTIPSR